MGTTMKMLEELHRVQLAQQLTPALPQQTWQGFLGDALGGALATDNIQGWQQQFQYAPQPYPQPPHRVIKFFRINQPIEIDEGVAKYNEPLDELRIKVANWLNN